MNAIIVEDEAIAARKLTRLLEARNINIVDVVSSVKNLKNHLHEEKEPDIYFFDIHLSDGIVFDALADKQPSAPIIFTTAYILILYPSILTFFLRLWTSMLTTSKLQ